MSTFTVIAVWDRDAGVWSASSEDIPGLNIEAETWDRLKDKVRDVASELIALNNVPIDKDGGEIHIVTDERVSVAV